MRTSISELEALAALAGGVDAAADTIGLDEELYQRAVDDERLSRTEEAEIDRQFAEFADTGGTLAATWERLSQTFEFELSPVVSDAISNHIQKTTAQAAKKVNQIQNKLDTAYNQLDRARSIQQVEKIEAKIGALSEQYRAAYVEFEKPIKEFIGALDEVNWDVYDRDNEFWQWFREIYGD